MVEWMCLLGEGSCHLDEMVSDNLISILGQ